jgi:hypothetical protein
MKSNFVWLQHFEVVFFVELNGTLKLWDMIMYPILYDSNLWGGSFQV